MAERVRYMVLPINLRYIYKRVPPLTGTQLTPRFAPARKGTITFIWQYFVPWDDHKLSHPLLPFLSFSHLLPLSSTFSYPSHLFLLSPTFFIFFSPFPATPYLFLHSSHLFLLSPTFPHLFPLSPTFSRFLLPFLTLFPPFVTLFPPSPSRVVPTDLGPKT